MQYIGANNSAGVYSQESNQHTRFFQYYTHENDKKVGNKNYSVHHDMRRDFLHNKFFQN